MGSQPKRCHSRAVWRWQSSSNGIGCAPELCHPSTTTPPGGHHGARGALHGTARAVTVRRRPLRADTPTSTRFDLNLVDDDETAGRELAAAESGCCSFFTFTFDAIGSRSTMRIDVSTSQVAVLDALAVRGDLATTRETPVTVLRTGEVAAASGLANATRRDRGAIHRRFAFLAGGCWGGSVATSSSRRAVA